jgi:hypothetical protein
MPTDLLSYEASPSAALPSRCLLAIAAITCSAICCVASGYFLLCVMTELRLPLPSDSVGEVSAFTLPAVALAAIICALLSGWHRERLRTVAFISAALGATATFLFAWKLIVMVFFTPW